MKQAFIFWPLVKEDKPSDSSEDKSIGEPAPAIAETISTASGTKIVDIAKYEGKVNWDKLAPELALVIIKASGLYKNGADPQYANNVKGAVSHNVPFHVYHFLYCTTEAEAKRDAALFYNTVKEQEHMPLAWVLDCESAWGVTNSDAPKIAKVFEDELRRLAGKDIRVGIYVAHQMYAKWKMDYDHYDYVWIPRYGDNDGTANGSIKPSYQCDLWQYTSKGKIAGISGDVDMNIVMDNGKGLEWLIRKN